MPYSNMTFTVSTGLAFVVNDFIQLSAIGSPITTTTTTTAYNYWVFTAGNVSVFPANSSGYTLYTGGWTSFDDGQTSSTFPLGGDFYTSSTANGTSYLSTNGLMILSPTSYNIYGNSGDLYLTPGQALNDGDIQNFWYQNTVIGSQWKTSVLVYCGLCCGASQTVPYSYILNIYRDSQYQYIETCIKTNGASNAGPQSNPLTPTIFTRVWQSDLNGSTWTSLGFGSISSGAPIPTTTTTTTASVFDFIVTENNDPLITEDDNNLIMNYPLPTSFIITEADDYIITENDDFLTTQ